MTFFRGLLCALPVVLLIMRPVPAGSLLQQLEQELSLLAERCAPRIVTIHARFPSHVSQWGETGIVNVGTGLVVDSLGYIVTSSDVVTQRSAVAEGIGVVDRDNELHEAMLFGMDSTLRVAFLYAPTLIVNTEISHRSEQWRSGSFAVVMGNSSGLNTAVSLTTLAGARSTDGFWQLSTPASPGLSGAPVFDSNGNFGGLLVGEVGGRVGEYPGRPLPALMVSSDHLRAAMDRFLRPSPPSGRPWLGISVRPSLQSDGSVRVYVDGVVENSPAQAAGIQPGDLLLRIDETGIEYVADLANWVHTSSPGHNASLSVIREGKPHRFTITVGRR